MTATPRTEAKKYEFKTQPYEHQKSAIRAAWGRTGFAYLLEMGTGKSKIAIDELCAYWEYGLIDTALVLAPKGVYLNWTREDPEAPGELLRHMPDRIRERATIMEWRPGGGSKTHTDRLLTLLQPSEGLRILVMNTEALSSGSVAYEYAERFLRSGRALMTVDESTFIKNSRAERTRRVTRLGRLAVFRRIMTGSPVTKGPMDLYSQFEFLGPELLGFPSFFSYRARYAVTKQKTFGGARRPTTIIVAYRELDDLSRRIAPHSFRVTKEECLDLPPKIYTQRDVEMTDDQWRMYREMKQSAVSLIESSGTYVSASDVIVQILRLQQLVCGFVADEDGNVHDVTDSRVQQLMDILGETGGKTIIWSKYRHSIHQIVGALSKERGPQSVVQYHGQTSREDREQASVRFQNDPTCEYIVSTTETGGFGNTWHAAHNVVYFSNGYDLEKRLQSEDRAHRAGLSHPVTYIDMVARGTVDESIIKALRRKIDLASAVTGDGYKDWLI